MGNYELCPRCKGGRTQEKSYRVYEDDTGTRGVCFRASCGYKNYDKAGALERKPTRQNQGAARSVDVPYISPTALSGDFGVFYLWGVSVSWYRRMGWSRYGDYLHIPLNTLSGERCGYVLRLLPGATGTPKARTYCTLSPRPLVDVIGGPVMHKAEAMVLVEDAPSAAVLTYASDGRLHGVPLLGIHLNTTMVEEIEQATTQRTLPVFFALDADATDVAIRHKRNFFAMNDMVKLFRLIRDFKDMDGDELEDNCNELLRRASV